MGLDVFDSTIRNSDAEVAANAASDLPAGFGETFDTSLRYAGEWNNSLAYSIARQRALATYYDDVKARTGVQLPLYGLGGNVSLDELNEAVAKLPQDPNQPEPAYTPLTEGTIDAMALRRMAAAHQDAALMSARERSWGGTVGNIAGQVIGGLADPVQDVLLPLGGAGEAGIALRALEFAGIGAGGAALTAAASGASRERAVPGSSGEIPGEIAGAGLFGAGLGGAFGLLGKWLGAGRNVLPTSLRDDVNAATSEAQINASNVFPGVAGEAANRDAVVDAVRSIVNDEPVAAAEKFFEAFHGSPHDFERFDVSKIGAGEGAQAFGYGLYFAEHQGVARSYAETLSRHGSLQFNALNSEDNAALRDVFGATLWDQASERDIRSAAENYSERTKLDLDQARQNLKEAAGDAEIEGYAKERIDKLERQDASLDKLIRSNDFSFGLPTGNLYRVAIRADQSRMLDWDLPLKEQPEFVRRAIGKAFASDLADPDFVDHADIKAGYWIDHMESYYGNPSEIARRLAEAGVPGIKYFDARSRDVGEGTRNFVVFNDRDVEITHKNGRALSAAEMGDAYLRPITFGEEPDVERFDPIPQAGDDTASYWESRLEGASPEERQALGATDLTSEQISAFADDAQMPDAQAHDLEHLLTQHPDMEFTTQTRLDDGSYRLDSRPLKDVLAELGEEESAAKELQACVIGMEAAE